MPRNVLYLVGAGLTKALELPGNRVPMMADFLQTMAAHIEDPVIAKALVSYELRGWFGWPSTAQGRELAARIQDGDASVLGAFARELQRRPGENVEDLLSAVETGRGVPGFEDDINRLFWRIGFRLNLDLLYRFARYQSRSDDKHTAISFNYDVAFERALQGIGLWHPRDGYVFPNRYILAADIDAARPASPEAGRSLERDANELMSRYIRTHGWEAGAPLGWRILKPHGSLNWVDLYARMGEVGLGVIVDATRLVSYASEVNLPSADLAGPFHGVPCRVQIAAPGRKRLTAFDRFQGIDNRPRDWRPIADRLTELETEALRSADEVFLLGWSMPRTDSHHESVIREAVRARAQPLSRLVVVNRAASLDYFSRIRDAFGSPGYVDVFNDGFEDFVSAIGA